MKHILLYIIFFLPVISFAGTPLHGTKTISSSGSGSNNYLSISDAITALYANGVDGEVTFELLDPLYNDRFNFNGLIPGSSSTNDIIFISKNKDPNTVEIIHTAGGSGDNFIININQACYITFSSLKFTAGVSSYGRIVYSEQPNGNVTFEGNIFNGLSNSGTNIDKAIVYCVADASSEDLDFYDFNNNEFNEGSYGLYLVSDSTNLSYGLSIKNNAFSTNTTNIYLDYFNAFRIENNVSTKSGSNFAYLVKNSIQDFRIRYNKISSLNDVGKGIKLLSCNSTAPTASIDNNFIQASNEGILLSSSDNIDVVSNSINIEHPSLGADNSTNALLIYSTSSNIRVQANLLINKRSGYAYNAHSANISFSDYNNLYTTGLNIARWNFTSYTSLSSFVAASGTDGNSLDEPVTFVSVSDLHIQSTQKYLAGNTPIGYIIDIEGNDHLGFIGASEPKLNGTYTIGTGGYYSTINQAVGILYGWSHIFGPVTYNILDGTYNERIDLNGAILGSSSSRYITFQSNSGNAADVELTHTSTNGYDTENYVLRIVNAEYIKIKNLTLTATGTDFAKVVSLLGVTGNLEFYGNMMNGYEITSGSGSSDQNIISCDNSSKLNNSTFENNTLNNGSTGIGFLLSNSAPKSSNLKIIGNNISSKNNALLVKNADAPVVKSNIISNSSGYSVELSSCSNNFLFEKNQIAGANGLEIIYCSATSLLKGVIQNNFIRTKDIGISISGSPFVDVFFNNINVDDSFPNNGSKALYVYHGASVNTNNVIVKNNILNNNIGGYAIKLPHGTGVLSSCNYNNLYTTGTNLVYDGSTDYTNLSSWQTASSFDANSYNEQVTFVSATDLHIAGSPVHLDGTTILSVTDDIDGDTRNNPPFIGADEYVAALSGIYTIGSGGDFTTIAEAINNLYLGGVSGAVTFKLLNGTYTEQINLDGAISGSSATNTVTFESYSGNAADVVVTYTASDSASNYVLRISGAEHLKFKNLTLTAGGTDFAKVVFLENVTGNLEFYGNVMNGYEITSGGSSENQSIVYCGNTNKLNNTTFENNTLNYGYKGISLQLENSIPKTTNLKIIGNNITCKSICISIRHTDAVIIASNTCTNFSYEAIYLASCKNGFVVEKNISNTYRGIYLYSCTATSSSHGTVKNNFFSCTSTGINCWAPNYIDFYNNSVNITGGSYPSSYSLKISGGTNNTIVNNILNNYIDGNAINWESGTIAECNYNNLYTTGSTLVKHGSTDYATLADWQASPEGFGTGSYSEDVTFVSSTNLHIVSTPVPLNGTTIASVIDDIDGETRGTPPFIGADEPNGIYVSVKVFLEGPYNSPIMNASLSLPTTSPYPADPETVSSIPIISGNEVVDWVLLELRDENNSSTVLESQSAFLLQDGNIVDLDGSSPVHFTQPSDNYFIAVKHRNHLGVMSASAVVF